jgi:hypothetical protein|tara:strand:+ start:1143 stop:1907 length:765 start_codon:yes stop_codon:yes gene_type:complete
MMTEEKEAKGIAAQYLKDGIKINTSIPDRKKVQFDPTLSRDNPSQRYLDLLEIYSTLHTAGEGMFNGRSLIKYIEVIGTYLKKLNCKTLLDYGSGKGHLYTEKYTTVQRRDEMDRPLPKLWELDRYQLYDPAYPEHEKLPTDKFEAVICTDVIEHIPEADIGWVLDEIFSYATKMVFVNIACFDALKILSDGSNAHASVFHKMDWLELLAYKSESYKHLIIYPFFDMFDEEENVVVSGYKIDQFPRVIELKPKE